uniref:Putative secreted protein n=1 Tax=Amblyomma americanum TaxID=6943 RepID=A0A0C9SCQ3_AMBAM
MNALLLIWVLIIAAGLADGSEKTHNYKCSAPQGGCPRDPQGRQIWLLRSDGRTCYNVTTRKCDGYGLERLWDCQHYCIGGD